ncbi:DUF721 domain-containing protein [Holospora undulata]|uniref:Zn-ribbon-containing, possibly RNA-binding protein n=1 Tax=Holospora undulata HU1 TaxID=1321371 RepID=A0A061JG48_9PROT|nr:DUF721 domain-containing protein [Holospora undulata]ETZ04780.1 Zn-ribbon-containing, possibly RNA-binding protein [Holospora undulata HU1]
MHDRKKLSKQWKRGSGFQPLEKVCTYALGHIFQTKNFLYSKMANDWCGIVGTEIASVTRPCRIQVFKNEGTLLVEVDSSGSLWIPAHGATLIERVNQYLGYKGVARIVFRKANFQNRETEKLAAEQELISFNAENSSLEKAGQQLAKTIPNIELLTSKPLKTALIELACSMKIVL